MKFIVNSGLLDNDNIDCQTRQTILSGSTADPLATISTAVAQNAIDCVDPPWNREIVGRLAGGLTAAHQNAHAGHAGHGEILLPPKHGMPCYCRGTRIRGDGEDIAVEDLRIGDQVQTTRHGLQRVRWIGRRHYTGRFAAGNPDIMPVVFRRGALGKELPSRDLAVSPLHAMFLDNVLIPARELVNGHSIVQVRAIDEIAYFHIELDHYDIIFANDVPSETFVDDASRGMFHNAHEFAVLYPDRIPTPVQYCARRLEEGAVIDAARQRLDRSGQGARNALLEGFLDHVTREEISGWARVPGCETPAILVIRVNGRVLARVVADRPRGDIGKDCGFTYLVPGGLNNDARLLIEIEHEGGSVLLGRTPWMFDQPDIGDADDCANAATRSLLGPLDGFVGEVSRQRISGWAWSQNAPDCAVPLQVFNRNQLLARTIANACRPDAEQTGQGLLSGFDIVFTVDLSPFERHVLEIRREQDGARLGEPIVIEPVDAFDAEAQAAINRIAANVQGAGANTALPFMTRQVRRLSAR